MGVTESGHKRSVSTGKKLKRLGKLYRKTVPRRDRTYRRWLLFLDEHEPKLRGQSVEHTYSHYDAAHEHGVGD